MAKKFQVLTKRDFMGNIAPNLTTQEPMVTSGREPVKFYSGKYDNILKISKFRGTILIERQNSITQIINCKAHKICRIYKDNGNGTLLMALETL